MKAYRVEGGTARIGMGEVIGLTEDQFRAREHRVTAMDTKGEIKMVRTNEVLEFKTGEELRLAGAPPRHLEERLVPLSGSGKPATSASSRAKTGAQKKAAAKTRAAQAAARAGGDNGKVAAVARTGSETGHTQGMTGTGGTTGTSSS